MTNKEFVILYDKYHKFSAGIIYKLVKDTTETEALCNEVFYSIYSVGEELDLSDELAIKSYIAVTSANRARDYFKRGYVKHEYCILDDEENWEDIPDYTADPEKIYLKMEEDTCKKMVLSQLYEKNPVNYDILMKIHYLGIPPEVVAKEYGCSTNVVNNRVFRTRIWLKNRLRKLWGE